MDLSSLPKMPLLAPSLIHIFNYTLVCEGKELFMAEKKSWNNGSMSVFITNFATKNLAIQSNRNMLNSVKGSAKLSVYG